METMWSDLDIVDRALVAIGLSWSFFTALFPGRSERPADPFFLKVFSAFLRATGILLAVVTIIAVRRWLWE